MSPPAVPTRSYNIPILPEYFAVTPVGDQTELKKKIFQIALEIINAMPPTPSRIDKIPVNKLNELQELVSDFHIDYRNSINRVISDLNRIENQSHRLSEMDTQDLDRPLNEIGLNIRIASVWHELARHTMDIIDDTNTNDEIPKKYLELSEARSKQYANRKEEALKLAASEAEVIHLCLQLDSQALKKFIVDNKLDLSLIPRHPQSADRLMIGADFTTKIIMHFCQAQELTAEHFNVLTVLIDAGCNFQQVFSQRHILNFLGNSSGDR